MAKLIRDPAKVGDSPCVEFHVYRSPRDGETVCGYANFDYQSGPREVTFVKSDYGVPVREALAAAKQIADAEGVPFLLIEDPHNLFPDADC